MTVFLLLAKEFGLPGLVVLACVIVLIKQKDKVDKDECKKNRAGLYKENKEVLNAVNNQAKANEREFGGIQATLKAINSNLNRMNGR